jgi:pilus assembly protein Flp/PilA
MKSLFSRFIADESGATAIEYCLIAAIIGVGISASILGLRDSLTGIYARIETEVSK